MRADDNLSDARRMVDDLLELYAIHALPTEEAQAFEAALGEVDEATRRRVVDEIRETRDAVARWAVEFAETPAPSVRERVLTAVNRPEAATPAVSDDLTARRARRNGRRRIAVAVSSAAAAVLLVVGGVIVGRSTVSTPVEQPPVAQSDQTLQSVMSRPDVEVHRTQMTGMPGSVVVASSRSADKAVIVFDGAQSPPTEHVYQLWLIGNTHKPRSAGMVSSVSTTPVVVTGLTDSRTIGMTVEPDGGSPQPTGDVVAAVTF
jgi:anti-sigma-K factor RskA